MVNAEIINIIGDDYQIRFDVDGDVFVRDYHNINNMDLTLISERNRVDNLYDFDLPLDLGEYNDTLIEVDNLGLDDDVLLFRLIYQKDSLIEEKYVLSNPIDFDGESLKLGFIKKIETNDGN